MEVPIIAVIIPTYNRISPLRKLLKQLYLQIPGNYKLIIIVVIDGSTDGTIEFIRNNCPEIITILGDGSWWYTKSINQGVKKALEYNPDYILTLNDDLELENEYINKMLLDLDQVGLDSILGSISLTKEKKPRITFGGVKKFSIWSFKETHYVKKFSVYNKHIIKGILPSIMLSGRGLLIPTKYFLLLNFYDEKLVQYSSETEFTYRAFKNGIKNYITYNSPVFENHKLTSSGAVYNNPKFIPFLRSYFNKYSINSIYKSFLLWKKHGKLFFYPIYIFKLILGSIWVYFLKYK